uniref:TOMM precursor leader peptide-binding protein n=1 Tax=Streptomyces albidus (ex Kaewkla and Franco 2022) TaxID=722709 RepID=UPI0015EEDAB3
LRTLIGAGLVRFHTPQPAPAPETDGDPALNSRTGTAAEAYWDLAGLDGARAREVLAKACVSVEELAGVDGSSVTEAYRDSGITVVAKGFDAPLTVVLCDDYLSPELREVDAVHRAQGQPWLLAKLSGTDPWVGPVFRPDSGPCWNCLAARLRGHRHSEWPVQRALGLDGPLSRPPASLPAGRSIALHVAVLETAKWLVGMRYPEQSTVQTLDTLLLRARAHPVQQLPQCEGCGDPGLVDARTWAPFVPASRLKASQEANGHRALTPAQMLEKHRRLVDPVTGIIKEIRRAPRSPEFIDCFLSGPNLAMGPHTLDGLRAGLRAISGGKGLTETEARTSALCEAVERYSGTRHGDESVVRETYRALGAEALHPNACQLYDERQFRKRESWNARRSPFEYVPAPFDEDAPVDWTPVWSLTSGRHKLLPTSLLYYANRESPQDALRADSNGCAAGSSPEDALVQGFLELVERDAVALWWYNRTRQPALDLGTFDEEYIERLRMGYRRMHRRLWALDLTSDLGIPVVAALSARTDKPSQDMIFGFGAHFDPRVALRRALTEMGQLLPAVSEVRADGSGYGIDEPEPQAWWRHATTANQPWVRPDPALPTRSPASWRYVPRGDLLEDVTAVTELVRGKGMELLVLDQSRPDLGLPVVKVLVPGLRHFWARLGPGRLYDVPVALGRLSEATAYEELNPISMFV